VTRERTARRRSPARGLGVGAAVAAGLVALPLMLEARLARKVQPLDDTWRRTEISSRGQTLLGISFRPRQAEAFGLELPATLGTLLSYPIDLVRLAAYWNRMESKSGELDTGELDWQVDAAEKAGKKVILSVGAVKNFGYPEFFVPAHHLERPLREGTLVRASTHPALLSAATRFVREVVGRYAGRPSVVAWQLEHEAVDPLGMEHSWRLSVGFVRAELDALREADRTRPVIMNGFLPMSSLVRLSQAWRTRGQGDSVAVAAQLADIVGIDYYPRHALLEIGSRTLYLDGARLPWQRAIAGAVLRAARERGQRVIVAEGQAEPWEAVTLPPNPKTHAMFSCRPQNVIDNFNETMGWSGQGPSLYAYLFWGAEYWVLRERSGDPSYLQAFARILDAKG